MRKRTLKKIFNKLSAVAVAGVLFASTAGMTMATDFESEIANLEQRQQELAREREEVEASLKEYENNAAQHELYLEKYDEKMKLQEEEIATIKAQMDLLDEDIAALEEQIEDKRAEIDESIEDFKRRLRVMYMTGNDSMTSMLVGSTDFYDILARMELIERVSRHDNDMIDDLNVMIDELNMDIAALETNKESLEKKKKISEGVLEELQKTYAEHEETKAWYEKQAEMDRQRTAEMDAEEAQIEEELQDFIRKQQEELERKRKEEEERRRQEEERKRKEEEERRRQEEEKKRLEAEAAGETYTPPAETEPVETEDYTYVTGASGGFIWPCPTVHNMTDGYGSRYIVEEGRNDFHKGIDITKPGCAGEPIVASASGTVITASNTGNGYGIHVVIDHGDKIATLYAHMSSCAVSVGDEVEQGQTIGYIGCTGYAYGNHLHFEVRVNGQHTEPLDYVSM